MVASLPVPTQSCYRAWEYLGFIAEKDQLFQEAAERYEKAWHFSHQRNPSIGGSARLGGALAWVGGLGTGGGGWHRSAGLVQRVDAAVCRLSSGLQPPSGPSLCGCDAGLPQDLGGIPTVPKDTEGDLGQGKGVGQVLTNVA